MAKPKLAVINHEPTASARPAIAVVLFGRDSSDKREAASFLENDTAAARSAAEVMDFKLAEIGGDAATAIAKRLPAGKVFPSGKAFMPFVKATLYSELLAAIGEEDDTDADKHDPEEQHEKLAPKLYDFTGYRLPPSWGDITLGSLVLAATAPQEGWWEALITEVKDDGLFVLKLRDSPDDPPILRCAHQLGLLPVSTAIAA